MQIGIGSTVLKDWKIVGSIGRGSFGSVYLIERTQEFGAKKKQYSALKVIQIPKDSSEITSLRNNGLSTENVINYLSRYANRICQEIDMMIPFKGNSYIVNYEDHQVIHEEGSMAWTILIRLELLTPLGNYTLEHPLNVKQVVHLGIDICSALETCETRKIMHRDIKPANIFIGEYGTFKLGDFGIARTVEGSTQGTMTGTYSYMAPEMLKGLKYDYSVDLYSLGAVLYQFLNHGRLPFYPTQGELTHRDIETAQIKRVSGKDPIPDIEGIDESLNHIVKTACAYNPEDRYASATEMKRDLLTYEAKCKNLESWQSLEPLPSYIPVDYERWMDKSRDKEEETQEAVGVNKIEIDTVPLDPPPEQTGNDKKKKWLPVFVGVFALLVALTGWLYSSRPKEYQLTVNGGSGGGTYKKGTTVTVLADLPETGMNFREWTVEQGKLNLADQKQAEISFEMPGEDIVLSAEFYAAAYSVTIENGEGGGFYQYQEEVHIKAEEKDGNTFSNWEILEGNIMLSESELRESECTFFMPAENLSVRARYEEAPVEAEDSTPPEESPVEEPVKEILVTEKQQKDSSGDGRKDIVVPNGNGNEEGSGSSPVVPEYTVTVFGGSGAGSYKEGDIVSIVPEKTEGKVFRCWYISADGGQSVQNDIANFSFEMPAVDLIITAVYDKN